MRLQCVRSASAWSLPVVCTLAIVLPLSLAGCGGGNSSGKKLTAVSGQITYGGKPLPNALVAFMNETDATATPGTGMTNSSGNYSLKLSADEVGVPAGKYKIGVTAWEKQPSMGTDGKADSGTPAIPQMYFDPNMSGLTATVENKSSQTINLDLKKP
ncbi:MAG TPA: carboxypeptidase-like regulatory domain-containing protein [Planctomycetaceae bacterium]|nr:carboxypeptidase-like regulatory domain-containing protein [Planctomycetaceae bacterium]